MQLPTRQSFTMQTHHQALSCTLWRQLMPPQPSVLRALQQVLPQHQQVQPPSHQAFWQPIEPAAIGHSILRPEDPILTIHSHYWVCPEHARPLRLFSCWCSQMNFLKKPLSGKLARANYYPFTKNRWLVPGISFSTGLGWGYRDSLLETAQNAVTVLYKCV